MTGKGRRRESSRKRKRRKNNNNEGGWDGRERERERATRLGWGSFALTKQQHTQTSKKEGRQAGNEGLLSSTQGRNRPTTH